MKRIEISKEKPPVISWLDKDGWVRREKANCKSLKEHGFRHCVFLSVLLLLADILCGSGTD